MCLLVSAIPRLCYVFSMTTLLYSHPAFLAHDTGAGHPERADRLRVIVEALETEEFKALVRRQPPKASEDQIRLVHPQPFIDRVMNAIPLDGHATLDPDTIVSPGSGEAALRAVGAVCAAVDEIIAGTGNNAFCAVRPPGHHAEPERAMGFCLFNSVAIGAQHARAAHGLERIAVIDFDVHHGNGTQVAFEDDPDLFYASTHQWPHYPGSGAREETGLGNIFNEPLNGLSGGKEFRAAYEGRIFPALVEFQPDFIFISAGFDAHADDPLASLRLVEEDYAWVTRRISEIAGTFCSGRVVSALEGGYNLSALSASVAAHVRSLIEAS